MIFKKYYRRLSNALRLFIFKAWYFRHLKFPCPRFWNINIHFGFEITQYPGSPGILLLKLGRNTRIDKDVWVKGYAKVLIGDNVVIGRGTVIECNTGIQIGDNVLIAENVAIRDTDHRFSDIHTPIRSQGIITAKVMIGNDVWIGYGAVITKGIIIGEGSVIGANSVVTKDVPPYMVVAGSPARIIRKRGSDTELFDYE
jgi:acetyltransferase-like isoleucine patch superfamily enzyme